jgi:hypothetical protein
MCYYSAAKQSLDTEVAPSVGVLVSYNSQFCADSKCRLSQLLLEQTARYSISFELLSGPSMIDTPKPLRWWQGSELIRPRDTPTIGTDQNLKRRWSADSDEWADRSLEAQLKCRRRHSPVPGWKREGSQWVFRPICWRLATSKSGR